MVRQGETQRLCETIEQMIDKARRCSNDPICLGSTEQGLYALNYAACYACSLVPEVSCEYSNLVLDRSSLVGNDSIRGFLSDLIE